jgi:hypothetical protein
MAQFLRMITPDGIEYMQESGLPTGGRDRALLVLPYPRCATDRAWEVAAIEAIFDGEGTTFIDDDHPSSGPFSLAAFKSHLQLDQRGRVTASDGRW